MSVADVYPVRVDASLDAPLSRWLWLVKWVLLIPHFVVLTLLWLAFAVLSAVAFFAILFTGRYPRAIFEFNVGVLRWTWRVEYYAIGAFGTDRYPPFTLADAPSYPAHLEVEYPSHLSRGLVLVKWWLLAIPHYIIVALFTGSGAWLAWRPGAGPGLIGVLALIAGVFLLVTGRYPEQIFDFVLGMNRWVLRVAAYAGLMTDEYPPFRLDMGGREAGGRLAFEPGGPVPHEPPAPAQPAPAEPTPAGPGTEPPATTPGWATGRVVSVAAGAVLALCSLGVLGAGGAALWADTTQRTAGLVDLGTRTYTTAGHALTSGTIGVHGPAEWLGPLIGQVRIRVAQADGTCGVFAGIAPAAAASRYLAGVAYTTVTGDHGQDQRITHHGTAVPQPPASAPIWAAQASGPRTASLDWVARDGDWTVVVMNADGSAGLAVRTGIAGTFPALPWLAAELLTGGVVLALISAALIIVPVRLAAGS
jgi:hypothetical protein